MISASSRYSNSKVVTLTKNSKSVSVVVPSASQSYTFNYVFHTVAKHDRIDSIANAFYNDSTQWWRIGDANPEIMDWTVLTPGQIIRIPNA